MHMCYFYFGHTHLLKVMIKSKVNSNTCRYYKYPCLQLSSVLSDLACSLSPCVYNCLSVCPVCLPCLSCLSALPVLSVCPVCPTCPVCLPYLPCLLALPVLSACPTCHVCLPCLSCLLALPAMYACPAYRHHHHHDMGHNLFYFFNFK